MTPQRLEAAAPRSRVKHSTTEPLRSHHCLVKCPTQRSFRKCRRLFSTVPFPESSLLFYGIIAISISVRPFVNASMHESVCIPTSPFSGIFTTLSINLECSNSNVFKKIKHACRPRMHFEIRPVFFLFVFFSVRQLVFWLQVVLSNYFTKFHMIFP